MPMKYLVQMPRSEMLKQTKPVVMTTPGKIHLEPKDFHFNLNNNFVNLPYVVGMSKENLFDM
jgi:hypothetical protein